MVDPSTRRSLVHDVEATIEEMNPRDGHFEGIAAAEICRAAGRVVLPLPIEAMILRRPTGRPLGLLSPHGRLEHGDLFEEWDVLNTDGDALHVAASPDLLGSKVGPFVNRTAPNTLGSADPVSPTEQALLHVLSSWYVLGALEQALDLATMYATERVAFGAPIASYQGVAFPLADACSELQALYELALHSLWGIYQAPGTVLVDALALRWATIDIARRVMHAAHQVLGAVGLCDEHDLTTITFALQARLRLPHDLETSMKRLREASEQHGFDSLFTPVDTS
jgi:acyl-CoA dehydrogenase